MTERLTGPSMLALVGEANGPSLWRVYQPLRALADTGYPCGWMPRETAELDRVAQQFDGFILPRLAWPPEQRWLGAAWFHEIRRAGRLAVFDCDDDLFTSAYTHRAIALGMHAGKSFERLEAERAERIWALTRCDGVTVSTPRLATIVRSFTDRPVIVVPNAIDVPWFRSVVRATRRQISGLTIGWAGGARDDRDLALMAEGWGRIARRYPAVTFVVQGHVPAVVSRCLPPGRLVAVPWMRLESYPAGLAQIDIACCSVQDTPFNRAKSPIKVMEAAVAGSVVAATPMLYGELVEHGRSGYLASTVDDWESALAALVTSESRRRMLATRLLKHVERHCSLSENLWRWPAAWAAIAEDARSRRGRLVAV